jgi:hypothetical protein
MFDVGLNRLNRMSLPDVLKVFGSCCGSSAWCFKMAKGRPYPSQAELLRYSDLKFGAFSKQDWLEAFAHHGSIDEMLSGHEALSDEDMLELKDACRKYRRRYDYTFVVDIRHLEPKKILVELRHRLNNNVYDELFASAVQESLIAKSKLIGIIDGWNQNFEIQMSGQESELDTGTAESRVIITTREELEESENRRAFGVHSESLGEAKKKSA